MIKAWTLSLLLFVALLVASLFVGIIDVGLSGLFSGGQDYSILVVSRIPRAIAIVLTGASLAIAGLIMQMMVRNRFVEPMTAGSGASAALGILLVTILMPAASIMTKMLVASIVSLVGTMGLMLLIRRLPVHQPLLAPLVAIAYGSVIEALVRFLAYQNDLLQYLEVWLHGGDFSGILQGRYELLWLAGLLGILAYLVADQFTILGLGKEVGINLGLNYHQIIAFGLVLVSLISALTVVTVGIIPFVGLVVPNIVSRWLGDNLRMTLPVSALMGASLVLVSDLIGRLVHHPFEIPVSTIFGVVGTILFLWLLYAPAGSNHSKSRQVDKGGQC